MYWFDVVTPKSVMFFRPIIEVLQERGNEVIITTRSSEGYIETIELLRLYNLDYYDKGEFGGGNLKDKLNASLNRQSELMDIISHLEIEKLICLCSVDANRIAYGLGIPIINFYDIPLSDYRTDFKKALPQARLTLPLSDKVLKPFVVPDEIFLRFSLEQDQIYEYQFIDPLLWLKDFVPDYEYVQDIFKKYKIDKEKPFIVIREEEYKSSYVNKKYPFLYETIVKLKHELDVNIIFIPRYESDYLKIEFPDCYVLEEKIVVQHLLYYANLFIGGGGTLNTEACFLGTPTISTRSFISHYDKYLIDKGLMVWVNNCEDLINTAKKYTDTRQDSVSRSVINEMNVDIESIIDVILKV